MTTHLSIRNGFLELDTFTPLAEDLLEVDFDQIADFDYVLNLLTHIVNQAAYEWDGPQTMRLIALLATEHLKVHGQAADFTNFDISAIRERIEEAG
jgi:hypothetical protein